MVFEKITQKYIRIKSGTFWIGVIFVMGGIVELIDAFLPLGYVSAICYAVFGDNSPFMLMLTGSGIITMRGAIPPTWYMK